MIGAFWVGAALAAPPSPEVVAACDAALAAREAAGLHACVEAWVAADARDPNTDWYAFHLAVVEGDATAAVAARSRALAHGLDEGRARELGRTELPPNPMLLVQRVFLALILLAAGAGMVWARSRAMRATAG